jgi:hypothetical protein
MGLQAGPRYRKLSEELCAWRVTITTKSTARISILTNTEPVRITRMVRLRTPLRAARVGCLSRA